MSPFDFILLPDNLLPSIKLKSGQKQAEDDLDQAGFKVKKSLFLELVLGA